MFLGSFTGECRMSSYYTTMCVSLMMLLYVCPHGTTNLVMFSFFALGCSDGQTRQLSNDLRGLLSFFFYLFFLFSFFFAVKEPLIILNEYCSGGNLEDYLLQKRKGGRSSKPWIPPPKQVSVPVSCVCGCEGWGWGCAPCLSVSVLPACESVCVMASLQNRRARNFVCERVCERV